MAGSYVFPTRLFSPSSLKPSLVGAAQSGGLNLAGEALFADLSGGGRWQIDFGESTLWTPALVKPWRQLAAAADNGATPILVPLADRLHQPLTPELTTPDTFGLSVWVDDATAWAADQVTAALTADAALRATQIHFDFDAPVALVGGEHFSILHEAWGWRLYRIRRVISGGLGTGDATVCEIRPPLREASATDTALNFDSPRCTMRVEGDMDATVEMLKFGKGSATFAELPTPS